MAKHKKTKLERLQKKYNALAVEYELTKGHFDDFAESSVEQTKELLGKIERLNYAIIFRDRKIKLLKKLVQS